MREFLSDCCRTMRPGAWLCTAETFIPEGVTAERDFAKWYSRRAAEGSDSTFWGTLSSLTPRGVADARHAAAVSEAEERHAGRLVAERKDEYLVTASWMRAALAETGFEITLGTPVNTIGEYVFLARKPERGADGR